MLIALCFSLLAADPVILEIVATLPAGTADEDKVYVAGNVAALGRWSPVGLLLERAEDGTRRARLEVPAGTLLEFKLTRGSWQSVEQDEKGRDILNRTHTAQKSERIDVSVRRWRSGAAGVLAATHTGDIRLHPRFASKLLGNERTVRVYLPPPHASDPTQRYPVLYLQDGQNVFDAATAALGVEWGADETAERLIRAGRLPPVILVGADNNSRRMDEYTPSRMEARASGGKGDLYVRFLVEELKPFIDATYRTRPDRDSTAVAGSSLGGLISLQAVFEQSRTFGACAALSPYLGWDDSRLPRDWSARVPAAGSLRVWIDMGTQEGLDAATPGVSSSVLSPSVQRCRDFVEVLVAAGWLPGRDYYYLEVAQGKHDEAAWAARFDKVLLFLFGKRQTE